MGIILHAQAERAGHGVVMGAKALDARVAFAVDIFSGGVEEGEEAVAVEAAAFEQARGRNGDRVKTLDRIEEDCRQMGHHRLRFVHAGILS
jgi:hypothetical protein